MVKKIISGGQTGVDRAALDAAIKLMIPHGGWIPLGRLTEDGPLPPEYHLEETDSVGYTERTEKNVLAADGTLIISRGPLSGGSEYTRELAVRHHRFWIHIDLTQMAAFQAAVAIKDWIFEKNIQILNVAGPRASKDANIYTEVVNILESAYYLAMVQGGRLESNSESDPQSAHADAAAASPQSLDEAALQLISRMSLKDKTTVANMSQVELPSLYSTLGGYILENFGLLSGNRTLLESCRRKVGDAFRSEDDAVAVIIQTLWEKLQQTHRMRVIK